MNWKDILKEISPILINPKGTSIEIGLSKRFLLFQLVRELTKKIEDDPYLNFISVLKNYKALGRILHGTIYEFNRDKEKSYFKNFFYDMQLYKLVKKEIEWVYKKNKELKMTLTKRGLIIYDNYKKNKFNVLLLTIHSGTWMPTHIQKKQILSEHDRLLEEDIGTDRIYGPLVLDKGGIWIDNKFSRFACDYNRNKDKAIYSEDSEEWLDKVWDNVLTEKEREWLMEGYDHFYFTLSKLVDSYRFNIIFDGHSMKDKPGRPEISFGTQHIPPFYMPIVRTMQKKLKKDYDAHLDKPYSGGHILEWLNKKFPDVFIFSMEVNKKLYMNKERTKINSQKLKKLSNNINTIFDIKGL